MFVEASQLPKSATDGPENWDEAWARLVFADRDASRAVEATNSTRTVLEEIYDERIQRIESLTGQRLSNPIRTNSFASRTVHTRIGTPVLFNLPRDAYTDGEEAFEKKAQTLAEQFPQINAVIAEPVETARARRMQEAERAAGDAALSPELGPAGRLTAHLVGGVMGAAYDPFQWQVAGIGVGGSAAGSVAGRIGKTMLSEFVINGGAEAFLQAASQERKKAAGLEHGLADAMANIGIAGTFGALFGGTVQAGTEIARVLKLGEGGAERATRVLEGRPEPGDVEAVAAASGRTLDAGETAMIGRSFEERTLDDMMIPIDPTPDDITLMSAAVRHAEDPDNFPPPELVERALTDSADGPARTLSADDYQRIYDGDPVALDTYRDQVAARSVTDAIDIADTFDPDPVANMRIRPDEVSEPFDDAAMVRAERMAGIAPAGRAAEAEGSALALDPVPGAATAPSPAPERAVDLLPFEDGSGNRAPVSFAEALAFADEPTFHADLLEACKL